MGWDLSGYWLEILFSLISALIFWVIHHLSGEIKKYKKLAENQENEVLENIITAKLKPIEEHLIKIDEEIKNTKEQNKKYYATLLQDECRSYIKRGYVTSKEFAKTSELLHIYENLGGNGKIHDLWQKVLSLEVRDE